MSFYAFLARFLYRNSYNNENMIGMLVKCHLLARYFSHTISHNLAFSNYLLRCIIFQFTVTFDHRRGHSWFMIDQYNILSRSFTATNSFSCVTIGFSYSRRVSSVTEIIINVRRNQTLNPPGSAAILAYAFFSMIATCSLKDKSRSNVTPRILRVGSISMDLSPIKILYGYWDFPSVIAWVLVAFTCR